MSSWQYVPPANYLAATGDDDVLPDDVESDLLNCHVPFEQLHGGRSWIVKHDGIDSILDDARFKSHVHLVSLERVEAPKCNRGCQIFTSGVIVANMTQPEINAFVGPAVRKAIGLG